MTKFGFSLMCELHDPRSLVEQARRAEYDVEDAKLYTLPDEPVPLHVAVSGEKSIQRKVMAELPNPINFEAATVPVRPDDMAEDVACGDDPQRFLDAIREWTDAGFDQLALVQVGPDQEAFFRFWEEKLRPELG